MQKDKLKQIFQDIKWKEVPIEELNHETNSFSIENSNVIGINLSNNGLEELPVEIGDFLKLQKLNLKDNNLEELPVEIGQLTELVELNLKWNSLIKLPVSDCDV